ncbi:MAG: hypothetical protein F6J93_34415 [Oscillatoria sp. SIO1A7]|nr:hypothetical protein [Oscillatoria sp. SIO1A7]
MLLPFLTGPAEKYQRIEVEGLNKEKFEIQIALLFGGGLTVEESLASENRDNSTQMEFFGLRQKIIARHKISEESGERDLTDEEITKILSIGEELSNANLKEIRTNHLVEIVDIYNKLGKEEREKSIDKVTAIVPRLIPALKKEKKKVEKSYDSDSDLLGSTEGLKLKALKDQINELENWSREKTLKIPSLFFEALLQFYEDQNKLKNANEADIAGESEAEEKKNLASNGFSKTTEPVTEKAG